jgi:hypothetical protein
LVNTAQPLQQNQHRTILASCETLRRKALVSYEEHGAVTTKDVVCFGVASVFCRKEFRMRGYARRLVKELSRILSGEMSGLEPDQCKFSILYSDVGTVRPQYLLVEEVTDTN